MAFFETPRIEAVVSTGSGALAGALSWEGRDNNVHPVTSNVLRRFMDPMLSAAPGART